MTHQIPSHLAFCTPGQNKKKTKQGTNPETLKRNKQTHSKDININTKVTTLVRRYPWNFEQIIKEIKSVIYNSIRIKLNL